MTKQDALIEAFAEKYCKFFWRNWNRDAFSNKETIISDLRTLLSQLVPGEEEIESKLYEFAPVCYIPETSDDVNACCREDAKELIEWVINRLTGKE